MIPPRLADHTARDYCEQAARHLLRERQARYPALVDAGKMDEADAATSLERARVLVAQWDWIMRGPVDVPWDEARGIHGFGLYNHDLAEETAATAARARAMADRHGDDRSREIADLHEALAWHQRDAYRTSMAAIVWDVMIERRCARPAPAERRRAA